MNKELIHNKGTTFYAKIGAGIHDGDFVVINKSLEARNDDYIAAFLFSNFTLNSKN